MSLLQIIVCEKINNNKISLNPLIHHVINKKGLNMRVILATSNPYEVTNYVKIHPNKNYIFFLDVKLNGIEIARTLRKYDLFSYIVMVNFDISLISFQPQIKAIDYLFEVPNNEDPEGKIEDCLINIESDYKKIKTLLDKKIIIDTGCKIFKVDPEEIIYIETDKDHRIKVHTLNEEIGFYGSLKMIETLVPSYYFKVHRSYIVNTHHIKTIDKVQLAVFMTNKAKCYVSKRRMSELISLLSS